MAELEFFVDCYARPRTVIAAPVIVQRSTEVGHIQHACHNSCSGDAPTDSKSIIIAAVLL